jgi:hypothetical protein
MGGVFALWVGLSLGPVGCGSTPPRSPVEDVARKAAPLPACVLHLAPRKAAAQGAARTLREEQYWKLVFPTFDASRSTLPDAADDCVGATVLASDTFKGASPVRTPLKVEEGDIVFGAGADRLKVAWLRSHHDGPASVGALALVRTLETHAEVYAVGSYRGVPDAVRLGVERIGPHVLVTAFEDTCKGRKPGVSCESHLIVHLARTGRLIKVADVVIERVAFANDSEPGYVGRLEYHLTSAVEFSPKGIRVLEQIRVKDSNGAPLRKLELDRQLVLDEGKPMRESAESLWPRVYPSAPAPKK